MIRCFMLSLFFLRRRIRRPAFASGVYISADMEGIGGVSSEKNQTSSASADYEKFRRLMTREVNAAISGTMLHPEKIQRMIREGVKRGAKGGCI